MDVLGRITALRQERGWSEYQLAERSGIPQSTISSWYKKGMTPSFSSLERICGAFGVTLSRFFDNGTEPITLSEGQRAVLNEWDRLNAEQQRCLLALMKSMGQTG